MYLGAYRSLIRSPVTSAYSAEVQQYLDRATGMDATHISAFAALIDGLVADSVWSKLDCLYILATDTEAHAKLNVKSSSFTITETGTVTFTADQGYTQTDADLVNYLNSTFVPSTAGGVFALDSAHLSIWYNTNQTSAVANIGVLDGTNRSSIQIRSASDTLLAGINQAQASNITVSSITSAIGHSLITRTGSATIAAYKNGSSIGTDTDVSTALPTLAIEIGGRNSSGTFGASAGQFSAATIGGGLDATEAAALYNRIATYRTAVGL